MFRTLFGACILSGCLVSVPASLSAQAIIHALTGTVSSIDNAGKTMTVFQDNGARGVYQDLSNPKTAIAFDKKVAAETVAASSFDKQGAYVIVFYFEGGNDARTVVALKSLGTGPFDSAEGTVTAFDARGHSISIEDKAGAIHTFKIGDQTVAESTTGVIEGLKLRVQKGDHVRVVSSSIGGNSTALFLRDL